MKNQVVFIIFVFFGFSFLMHVFPFIFVEAAKLQSGVTISAPSTNETSPAGTCGLQIMTGAPINYGQLNAGQVSDEQKVTIKNLGTATAQIIVKAGDWIGGTSANPIKMSGPEVTRVAVTPGKDFGTKFVLHNSEATVLSDLGPGQEQDSFWSLYADPKLSGSPHQEVSIDLICVDKNNLKVTDEYGNDLGSDCTKNPDGTYSCTKDEDQDHKTNLKVTDEYGNDLGSDCTKNPDGTYSCTKDEDQVYDNNDTIAKTPGAPHPLPIPYPNTNNATKAQITTD